MEFVSFGNYLKLFKDPVFFESLKNTIYIWIIYVTLVLIFAIIFATLLDITYLKLKDLFRTAYFMPVVTSVVVAGLVFFLMFQYERGIINYFFSMIGINKIKWLNSYTWSKIAVIIMMLWRWTGYIMILNLAGLQSINKNLYEAARIDGANSFNIFIKITLPLLRPVITFCVVITTIDVFQLFTEPFILTMGGPGVSTTTLGLYLYNVAFRFSKLGYASSLAYVITILTLFASIVQIKLLAKE